MKIKFCLLCFLLCAAVILMGGCSKKEEPYPEGGELSLWIASDIHYTADKTAEGSGAKNIRYISEILGALEMDIGKEKPDYLIVTGDITDRGTESQHRAMAERFARIQEGGTRVLVAPGNHDFPAEAGDSAFSAVYGDFGYKDAYMREGSSYCYRMSEDNWILMLDSGFYGQLMDDTFKFAEKVLKKAKGSKARVLVGLHHNTVEHIEAFGDGFLLYEADKFQELLEKYKVPVTLSGHIHAQDISANEDKTVTDIATGALVCYPHSVGVMTLSPENWHYETRKVPVTEWALSQPETDGELLIFEGWSRQWYMEMVGNRGEMSPEAREALKLLDLHFFMGDENDYYDEMQQHPGLAELLESDSGGYAEQILRDDNCPDNVWDYAWK